MLFIGGPLDGQHRAWPEGAYYQRGVILPPMDRRWMESGSRINETRLHTVTYERFPLHYTGPNGDKLRINVAVPQGQTFLETFDLLLKGYNPKEGGE